MHGVRPRAACRSPERRTVFVDGRRTQPRSASDFADEVPQHGVHCVIPRPRDLFGGAALLGEDPLGDGDGLLVGGTVGDATQQLVGRDLQVFERVGEPGDLDGGVGLRGEERAEVGAADAKGGVLEARGLRAS